MQVSYRTPRPEWYVGPQVQTVLPIVASPTDDLQAGGHQLQDTIYGLTGTPFLTTHKHAHCDWLLLSVQRKRSLSLELTVSCHRAAEMFSLFQTRSSAVACDSRSYCVRRAV